MHQPLNTRFSAHKNLHLSFPLDWREGLRAPGDSILLTVKGGGFRITDHFAKACQRFYWRS
jgi:hypothetical protein